MNTFLSRIRGLFCLLLSASSLWVSAGSVQATELRDDVLIIANLNSKDSLEVAEHYATARNINPANIVKVRAPASYWIEWDEFRLMRDQIIRHMRVLAVLPLEGCNVGNYNYLTNNQKTTADDETPYFCRASFLDPSIGLQAATKIKYLVTTRGVPTVVRVPVISGDSTASVDGFLRVMLLNYHKTQASNTGITTRLIVGRMDGLDKNQAMALVDRAVRAEAGGVYGRLFATLTESKSLMGTWGETGLNGPTGLDCTSHTQTPDGKAPVPCMAQMARGGNLSEGSIELAVGPKGRSVLGRDALVYLGNLDGQVTGGGWGDFNNVLAWRNSSAADACSVLCAKGSSACKDASNDVYKEINSACVGVAPGFIGYNFRSFPVALLSGWPTGWQSRGFSRFNMGLPELGAGAFDTKSIWFRNGDEIDAPLCYTNANFDQEANRNCKSRRNISFYQDIVYDTPQSTVNKQYKVSALFKTKGIDQTGAPPIRVYLQTIDDSAVEATNDDPYVFSEGTNYGDHQTSGWNGALLPPENQRRPLIDSLADGTNYFGWRGSRPLFFNLDTGTLKNFTRLRVIFETTDRDFKPLDFVGELWLDDIVIEELVSGSPSVIGRNSSFTEGYKQVSDGDHAAVFLSRLGGTAFWGTISHYLHGGGMGTGPGVVSQWMAGQSLGDAVWSDKTQLNALLYGDPLYSPLAVAVSSTGFFSGAPVAFYGKTFMGAGKAADTGYALDYCGHTSSAFECSEWKSTGLSGQGGIKHEHLLGNWDMASLPWGNYLVRLTSTVSEPDTDPKSFYAYRGVVNHYSDVEVDRAIEGYVRVGSANGVPVTGVNMTLVSAGVQVAHMKTDANGYYKFHGLKPGEYTLSAQLEGHNLVFPDAEQDLNTVQILMINESVHQNSYSLPSGGYLISGSVKDSTGQALPGVTINVAGTGDLADVVRVATTNVQGKYHVRGLGSGIYNVSPVLAGFTIAPQSAGVGITSVPRHFVASHSVATLYGVIRDKGGNPIKGAQVKWNNGGCDPTTCLRAVTNDMGFYRLSGLNFSGVLNLAISAIFTQGYDDEVSIEMDFNNANTEFDYVVDANFSAGATGYVFQSDGAPLAGTTVSVGNVFDVLGRQIVVSTGESGRYSFNYVLNGSQPLITPTKTGYTFSQSAGEIVTHSGNILNRNFIAAPQ